ncbi:hypothetical protein ACWIGI_12305 [Nocardia sp. NPDC055321]
MGRDTAGRDTAGRGSIGRGSIGRGSIGRGSIGRGSIADTVNGVGKPLETRPTGGSTLTDFGDGVVSGTAAALAARVPPTRGMSGFRDGFGYRGLA